MEHALERFWQERWHSAGLATARRDPGRRKFFALVAYPGSSGFLHIGHLRGPVLADILHRYHRMLGHSVLFPTGTHASGLPAVTFAQKVQNRDPGVVAQLELHGIPPSEWSRIEEPAEAARFLGREYLRVFRRLGLLIDESAYLTTIDEDYQAFIRWQFLRLAERGALRQGPHHSSVCPVCGPVSVDPSETDLSSGGDAETVAYTLVPFALPDGRLLLAGTLRPETVYGATNLWLPPSGSLVVWHQGERAFLVTRSGGERLVEQHGGHLGHEVPVSSLAGQEAKAPRTGAHLPIFSSPLVDPAIGTGVVMSVPGHAPADWLAVHALPEPDRRRIGEIPVVIEFPDPAELPPSERALLEGDGPPAARAVRATGAGSLADGTAVEEATQRLYRLEFLRGRMRSDLVDGMFVPPARARVAREIGEDGSPGELREFSKPVVCRNGHAVVIRKVPDQWFLKYGDAEWKEATRSAARSTSILPKEYAQELPSILDWFDDRPCTRKGRWLGTPFPQDPSWIIEPIADSTFYPAYFVVRRFVADGRVPVRALTEAFFDRVFLGIGPGEPTLSEALQEEIAAEFRYWYPLDLNIGGKEHKRVHFPVFLYTHTKLLPEELRPRGIFVHWWLTDEGGAKISKKSLSGKGGSIPPMEEALQRWGADALRLFYLLGASPQQDIVWDPQLVDAAAARLGEIERLIGDSPTDDSVGPSELDAWLLSRGRALISQTRESMERLSFREGAERVYVEAPTTVRRYLARGGVPGQALGRFYRAWVRLMHPMTPHLSEELGKGHGEGLVALRRFPEPEEFPDSPGAEAAEQFLDLVEEDLRSVLKPAQARGEVPTSVAFFVAEPWKRTVEAWMREVAARQPGGPPPIKELVERARSHPDLAARIPDLSRYVGRVYPSLRQERTAPADVDERAVLRGAEGYLSGRFRFDRVDVVVESEAGPHDPQGRAERARPGRPAFFLTGRRAVATPGS